MASKQSSPEKFINFTLSIALSLILLVSLFANAGSIYLLRKYNKQTPQVATQQEQKESPKKEEKEKAIPQGIMFLIEYKDTVGLVNFVSEMGKRGVTGLLMVTPKFVQSNCETIKEVIKHDVEIVGCNVEEAFWGVSYEEQKSRIEEMVSGIESCTGEPVRIINSRYFASDMNTIKAAEELGIPYVTARGVTGTKATVFQPEEYDVKVLSVSNIPSVEFEYGSLCDYSYFERAGTPQDMLSELERGLQPLSEKEKERFGPYHRITPVSHTNIGGYLEPWLEMWHKFWDNHEVDWVTLDEIMAKPDWELPLWQIPINKNAPYTSEKIRPLTPYEEEKKVNNPCAVEELSGNVVETSPVPTESSREGNSSNDEKILMFHNNKGPMCLEAKKFLNSLDYPVKEHLTTDDDFRETLNDLKSEYNSSEGVSDNFGYYPIIFVDDRAFSGFDAEVQAGVLEAISE